MMKIFYTYAGSNNTWTRTFKTKKEYEDWCVFSPFVKVTRTIGKLKR